MSLLYAKFYCVHNLIVCSMCAHCYCVQFLSLCVAVSTQFLLRTVGNCVQFLSLCVAVSTLFLLRTVGTSVQLLQCVLCLAGEFATEVWENGDWEEDSATRTASQRDHLSCSRRPNPAETGQRYFFSADGKPVRASWPLPKELVDRVNHEETSSSGCTKKRFGVMGHRQRAGLWIAVCMDHETIIGFHIMPGAEGKRDFLFPMYKNKEAPPEQIWVDFGCGCSEMALNYVPEYFKDVEFYVDAFHNYSHKCPGCFESKRFPEFEQLNTSLMEQINSFMQPLRGILKSGTTKVRILIATSISQIDCR